MRKFYLVLSFLLSISLLANAQQNKLLDVDYKQANISQMVSNLGSKTGKRFYYDPIQFDSLRVTLTLNQKPLEYILDKAFEHTRYHYAITGQQEVIMTKDLKITTDLAPGIFESAPGPVVAETPVIDYNLEEKKKIQIATTENKLYEIGIRTNNIKSGTANLAGYVRNAKSGEGIIGASIYNPDTKNGIATD